MNGQMAKGHGARIEGSAVRQKSGGLAALVLMLALAGCSDAPAWSNPVGWFDGMFSDDVDQLPEAPKSSAKTPGADKPYPKLGEAQEPSRTGSSAETRAKLSSGLIADRDNAKYTKQDLHASNPRLAAAPPPPKPTAVAKLTPVPMAKSTAPERIKDVSPQQMAAIPAIEGTAARSETPSLPAAPTGIAASPATSSDARATRDHAQVPSIVQRRNSLPPPPTPVAEVSRRPIPQIVETRDRAGAAQQTAGTAALPQPPAAVAPPEAPGLLPPAVQTNAQIVAQGAAMASSVQVNLLVGQDQSVLAQTFAASLAAQGSPIVRQPGNVFYASNAAPIDGQWPTIVPGVVQQAFNASLNGADRDVQSVQPAIIASPQMSSGAMRRLPGAPGLIRFGHGSISLSGKEKKHLGQIAKQAQSEGKTVYVVGHASQRTGDMDYAKHKLVNFNLSLDRANVVAGELRRRGVAADRIVVQAKGDADPLYFEFMPDGEAQNRRVEVYVR
ncbi:MAG: OmpA family protein [Proteobacteria bacterium]|nr:OmpA family protein [Pseudomonadota bacterium]